MNVIRKVVLGLAGVVVVAFVLELAAPKAVHAVVSTLVTVSNTSGNPVPTIAVDTRNVNVVNTPNVNVSSLPAVQLSGGVNATVSNPTDGSGNPIPLVTKDADSPARNAYSDRCGGNGTGGASCTFKAVPAGHELVIQGLILFALGSTGSAEQGQLTVVTGGHTFFHQFFLQDAGPCQACGGVGPEGFTATLTVPIYVDPGTTPSINVGSDSTSPIGSVVNATISGYLVSVP